jgi:hypothetical protein
MYLRGGQKLCRLSLAPSQERGATYLGSNFNALKDINPKKV